MSTRRNILIALLLLLTNGFVEMWAAVDIGDIKTFIAPASSGIVDVTKVEVQTGGDNKVTFKAIPYANYTISKKDIIAQPATDPSQTRTPNIASELEVMDGAQTNEYYFILPAKYDGAIITANFTPIIAEEIDDLSGITNPSGNYKFSANFSPSGTPSNNIGKAGNPFKGRLEGYVNPTTGEIKTISLSAPLFEYVKDAIIKNIVVEGTISGSGNVGAIAGNALGASRIYNCGVIGTITTLTDAEGKPVKDTEGNYQYTYGSTIDGNNNVGSIVGLLDGSSRVINCFSFAKIMSGSNKGGIVGYNNYFSESGDIQTMVMNCMFYGDIASGNTISPVYGGNTINNVNDVDNTKVGLNTYNYYRYESLYSKKKSITTGKYNCALAVKEQYLTRFEIYRQLLNSNRKLAAWYATGDAEKGKGKQNEMAKWVLDKSKAPYPILMSQAYYPSVVNYDEDKTYDATGAKVDRSNISVRSQGGYIEKENATQKLTINISLGSGAPTNAAIISDKSQITRKRIDKDTLNYNFNYDKVQLPYFSEVGTGNYGLDNNNKSRVVTGWKITGFGGSGTEGTFSKTDAYGGYNFADRNCTNKDLYSVSGRVFSQGAYFDVPYGVTSINIEPFWGYAAYVSDPYYDIVYKTDYTTPKNVTDMGVQNNYNTSSKKGSISIGGSTQTVYTSVKDAVNSMPGLPTGTTAEVYHYAVVLVGNMHLIAVPATVDRPFTIMSADLDEDREPDYSLIYSHASRNNGAVSPIRFDFINVPGTAMAQKPNGASLFRNVSIFKPKGWFEITNTCQISIVQFEYDNGNKSAAPVILLGGEIEQFVSTQSSAPTVTQYIHVGGNAWFKEFNNGTHSDGTKFTPHIPISATGGDYDKFYLSGAYKPDAEVSADNAEGYISGGRFGEMAGAGQQQIDGDVHWQIYDADIRDFYGGGINSDKPITGNITVDIFNSYVTTYCGGPKFGDMLKKGPYTITDVSGTTNKSRTSDAIVTTNATGCTFGDYFGAGYGGIAYVRKRTQDAASLSFGDWISNYTDNRGNYYNGTSTKIGDSTKGEKAGPGVAVDFDYEFFVWSTGETGGRFYIKYASLSFATTNDVNSTLNNCHITHNFYGGGNLGKVDGNATSALNGCTVDGEVFGAGYSASRPKVPYRDGGFSGTAVPGIDTDAGVFTDGVKVTITDDDYLTLEPGKTLTNAQPALGSGTMYTNYTEAQLNSLGTVAGKVTLTIDNYAVNSTTTKETSITGNVYGGGESSDVYGVNSSSVVTSEVEINIKGGSMTDVYGGGKGKTTVVGGDVTVNVGKLKDGSTNVYEGNATVTGSVYGGSALGAVNAKKDTDWDKETNPDDLIFIDGKETKVNILKGTVNGSVYGGGLGDLASLGTGHSDVAAKVFGDVTVTVGVATETAATTVPIIEGSVYGGSNVNGVLEKGARVDIISGTIGKETTTSNTTTLSGGNVHGGGYGQPTLVKGDVTVNVGVETNDNPAKHYGFATIKGDVYGGSAKGNVNATPNSSDVLELTSANVKTDVNLYGGTINGDLYGGGLGYLHSSSETESDDVAANVYGNVTVTVEGGKANRVFGCNNKFGTPKESVTVTINGTAATEVNETTKTYALQGVYGGGNLAHYDPTTPSTYPTVTVNGCGTSVKDVFGGGNAAAVPYTNVTINGGDIDRVFAGGNGSSGAANVGYKNSDETPSSGNYGAGTTNATIAGGSINQVFGGCNSNGTVRESGTLTINKSTAEDACDMKIGEVYGGGNLANGNACSITVGCTGTLVTGDNGHAKHPENIGTTLEGIGALYGGANQANIGAEGEGNASNITLNINSGIVANVFGGNNTSGTIYGTINVNIEKTSNACDWYVGNVYGGGNLAAYTGSPAVTIKNGTVSGNVYGGGNGDPADNTQAKGSTGAPTVTIGDLTHVDTESNTYTAIVLGDVYGGGNAAKVTGDVAPTVLVQKCNTEVGYVYGGGNAADVPATNVTITGGTISHDVYGGGHGDNTEGSEKAANVTNNVSVIVNGGTINKVFAGSNLNGSIGGTVTLNVNKTDGACDMKIGEVYGGGNQAAGNAGTITIGCTGTWTTTGDNNHTNANATDNRIGYELEGIGTVYGGANQANVGNDITLNITGGIIENAFGGNNTSGTIDGDITVNVEWSGTSCSNYLGNVYGGGNLAAYSQKTAGHPAVNINNGTVSGNVYGGGKGNTAIVTGNPVVTIGDATATHCAIVNGNVFGGGDAAAVTGNTTVTYNDNNANSTVAKLFGGGNEAGVSGTSTVTLANGKVTAGVYGGCNTTGSVGAVTVALNGGTIGTDATHTADVYGGGYGAATTTTGNISITLGTDATTGATIYGDIYGGSALGSVNASTSNTTTVTLTSATLHGSVFGGGKGHNDDPNDDNDQDVTATSEGKAIVNINVYDANLTGIYGGANVRGLVKGDIEVNINANVGTSGTGNSRDIFGGGYGAATNTNGNVTVTIGDAAGNKTPIIYGDVYGGSALGNVNDAAADKTTVNFLNGTLHGNIYGGGLGNAQNAAKVNGEVEVNIGTSTQTNAQCHIDLTAASIFGCNNTNGSPQDNVTVNIYKTAHTSDNGVSSGTGYAIDQVFGGGNRADYAPENGSANSSKKATVNVIGCENTIRRVFGGGNAAAAVGVVTRIDAGRFDYVYGGGNGEVTAANIGAGGTNLQVHGGQINHLFGGSNEQGSINGNMGVTVDNSCDCDGSGGTSQYADEFFCGNNLASIGTAQNPVTINATIACGTRFGAVYGGCNLAPLYGSVILTVEGGQMDYVYGGSKGRLADNSDPTNPIAAVAADISGDVTLTIKGGQIKNVFGGSNINGNIEGSIEVNIEKDDASTCNDGWYVGNVYGASNLAEYRPTVEGSTLKVNIKNGTVSGNVYGGGKGASATVTSNPVVTIGDVTNEDYVAIVADEEGDKDVANNNLVGGNVFGGGDAAPVVGSTTVTYNDNNANTTVANIYGGGNDASVSGNATVNLRGKATVEGDVFGGGNRGVVGGSATVNIE